MVNLKMKQHVLSFKVSTRAKTIYYFRIKDKMAIDHIFWNENCLDSYVLIR